MKSNKRVFKTDKNIKKLRDIKQILMNLKTLMLTIWDDKTIKDLGNIKKPLINLNALMVKLFLCLMVFSTSAFAQSKIITETFETAVKKSRYPEGEVTAPSGTWLFNEALLWDKEPTDFRPMTPRILSAPTIEDEPGSIASTFEVKGIKSIKVGFIGYKPDPGYFQIEVLVSPDKGQTWKSIGTARGRYDKSRETFASFKTGAKADEELRVKIANTSAPKLNRLNRINITLIEIEKH